MPLSAIARPAACGMAAALVLLAGCHRHHGDAGAITRVIRANVRAVAAAFNAHDPEKAASFDAPFYVGMMHGAANVLGPADDLASMRQLAKDPAARLVVGDAEVEVARAGDMAVSRAPYRFSYTEAASRRVVTEQGNWVEEWRPQPDGSWKVAWSVVSDTPAPSGPN